MSRNTQSTLIKSIDILMKLNNDVSLSREDYIFLAITGFSLVKYLYDNSKVNVVIEEAKMQKNRKA